MKTLGIWFLTLSLLLPQPQAWGLESASQEQQTLEASFFSDLNREADEFVAEFVKNHIEVDPGLVATSKRFALLKFRQFTGMKEIIARYGKTPSRVLFIGEVLSTFILPPIFTALGLPQAAGVSAGMPWGVIASAGVITWQTFKTRWNIARSLNMYSLRELDQIREELVGFDMKYRITSLVYQEVTDGLTREFGIEVVRKLQNDGEGQRVVSVSELEVIVSESGKTGGEFLDAIYLDKINRGLYASKLIRYIAAKPSLMDKLLKIVRTRADLDANPMMVNTPARELLLQFDDFSKMVELRQRQIQEAFVKAKAEMKKNGVSREDIKALEESVNSQLGEFNLIRQKEIRFEYVFLNNIRKVGASPAEVLRMERALGNGRLLLQTLEDRLARQWDRATDIDKLSLPKPKKPALSCGELFLTAG